MTAASVACGLVGVLVGVAGAGAQCNSPSCFTYCNDASPGKNIQRCDTCCQRFGVNSGTPKGSDDDEDDESVRLSTLEGIVGELRVMTGVMLALVLLLILAVLLWVLSVQKGRALKACLGSLFRRDKPPAEPTPQKQDPNPVVVRLANHQSVRSSPAVPRRPTISRYRSGPTEDTISDREPRVRQPSESTCPDESEELPPQAYDNLALSTSTIHNTSASSTDTLGPIQSTNTVQTTLNSVTP